MFCYNRNKGDINKGNYRISRYAINLCCNHNYNNKNRFGNHDSSLIFYYCASASDNNTMDNIIHDEDIALHCDCNYNRNTYHVNSNCDYYGPSNVISSNIKLISLNKRANAESFHNYKNDNTPVVDRNVNSHHHSNSRFYNHRQADDNDFHNSENSYFDNKNLVTKKMRCFSQQPQV